MALSTKWLNSRSQLRMFNLSFFTFATEHSPFAWPISASLPDKSMLSSHWDQSLDPFVYKNYIHDNPTYSDTLLALYACDALIMACNKNTNYMRIHLQAHISYLENFFNKWKIKVSPNRSQAVFFSKKRSLPLLLDLNGPLS